MEGCKDSNEKDIKVREISDNHRKVPFHKVNSLINLKRISNWSKFIEML